MKKTLFAVIVTSSSIAAAEPRIAALEDPIPAPVSATAPGDAAPTALAPALPTTYVSLGGAIGVGGGVDWMYGGTSIDGGYRLTDTLWVRGRFDRAARIGYGAVNQSITIVSPQHPHSDAMLGLETRRCRSEAMCLVAGADAGYRFGDSDYTGGVIMVPRIGLDLGSRHLRVRPGIEASAAVVHAHNPGEPALADMPAFGLGFTTALAYEW
jgi:hypothetical protein